MMIRGFLGLGALGFILAACAQHYWTPPAGMLKSQAAQDWDNCRLHTMTAASANPLIGNSLFNDCMKGYGFAPRSDPYVFPAALDH